jgi:hypothetical protein
VADVVRRAAADVLHADRSGTAHLWLRHVGMRVTVVARHQRGHDPAPDAYWWDAHQAGAGPDDGTALLLCLIGDNGRFLTGQLLLPPELAAYRAADLPRRERTAFTTTFTHATTHYGQDLTDALDSALDRLTA